MSAAGFSTKMVESLCCWYSIARKYYRGHYLGDGHNSFPCGKPDKKRFFLNFKASLFFLSNIKHVTMRNNARMTAENDLDYRKYSMVFQNSLLSGDLKN